MGLFSDKNGDDYFNEGVKLLNKKKYEKAFVKFKIAAEEFDHRRAQANVGYAYQTGDGVAKDYEQAMIWSKRAASRGQNIAQNNIGVMYRNGLGVDVDYKEAMRWFKKAANQDLAPAQYNLGTMYHEGQGVAVNRKIALQWCRKAAFNGDAEAKFYIGLAYQNGLGVVKDCVRALKYYKESAEGGISNAGLILGINYMEGYGITQDFQKAVYWLNKADDGTSQELKLCLGHLYENGIGVKQDHKKAQHYFDSANYSKGIETAMFDLGASYLHLDEGRKKPEKALYWFKKAAEKDNVHSLVALGAMHLMGLVDGKEDFDKAYTYLSRAANLENVQLNLDQLKSSGDLDAEEEYSNTMKWYYKRLNDGKTVGKGFVSSFACQGFLYHQGLGVAQDYKMAHDIYMRVLQYIDEDDTDATMCLGLLYLKGLGVEQDYERAMEYFRRSAKTVNTYTYNNIGDAYKYGYGVYRKDYKKAMKWYRKGVHYRDGYSQLNVGKMYLYGLGVKADRDAAFGWFKNAYKNGCTEASSFLFHETKSHSDLAADSAAEKQTAHFEDELAEMHLSDSSSTLCSVKDDNM